MVLMFVDSSLDIARHPHIERAGFTAHDIDILHLGINRYRSISESKKNFRNRVILFRHLLSFSFDLGEEYQYSYK